MLAEEKTRIYFAVKLNLRKISHVCAHAHVHDLMMWKYCAHYGCAIQYQGITLNLHSLLDKKFTWNDLVLDPVNASHRVTVPS